MLYKEINQDDLKSIISTATIEITNLLNEMYNLLFTKNGEARKQTKSVAEKKVEIIRNSSTIDIILDMKKIMWNELSLEDCNFQVNEMLWLSLFLKEYEIFTVADFHNFWYLCYINNLVNSEDLVYYIYAHTDKKELNELISWMNHILMKADEMGSDVPSLEVTISLFNGNVPSEYEECLQKLQSIQNRPEFLNEILENTTSDILNILVDWVAIPHKREITITLLERELDEVKELHTHAEISSHLNKEGKISYEMPLSYEVLGETISQLPAQTMEMDIYNKIPQKYLQEWLPKWVYSHPDIQPKISIYFPGGDGIGHSAIIVKTNEGMILMDFGLSVVNNSSPSWLPLLEKVDAVLLTHAHMDHSGSMPLLYSNKKNLPWFGTAKTKFMVDMLWQDTSRILQRNVHPDVLTKNSRIQALTNIDNALNASNNFNEVLLGNSFHILPNVEVTPFKAGHLFGSVGYELNIQGKRVFYSGDFNQNGTPLLDKSEFPYDFDYTIFDGTNYGRYMNNGSEITFENILAQSKRVIVPAFSIGRTQEMLYKLYQTKGIENWNITITGMGGKLTKHMNVKKLDKSLKKISIMPTLTESNFIEKTIVIAGQGMLQAGTSRNLFEYSKDDEETAIAFTGYQAPNTMGAQLLFGNQYLKQQYKQQLYRIKFSGHSTGEELDRYIESQTGRKIMVHSPEGAYERMKKDDISLPSHFKRKIDI